MSAHNPSPAIHLPAMPDAPPSSVPVARSREFLEPFDRPMRTFILVCLLTIACVDTARRFLPQLLRQDLFHVDACQHVWWTYRLADPKLFPNDPIADFMSLPIFAPPLYKAMYQVAVQVMDAQVFADLLPFLLSPLTWWLAWRLGRHAGGFVGACAAFLCLFYFETLPELGGGIARSFGLPMLMGGMLALFERRLFALGAVFLVASLMYPPVVITLGVTTAIVLGIRLLKEKRLPTGWLSLCVLGMLAIGCIGLVHFKKLPPNVGPKVTGAQARTMEEFGEGGRSSFFLPSDQWKEFYFRRMRSSIDLSPITFYVAVPVILITLIFLRRAVPWEGYVLLVSSACLFVVAHLVLFSLYLPNRQVVWSFPIFGMLWFAGIAKWVYDRLSSGNLGRRMLSSPVVRFVILAILVVKTGLITREGLQQTWKTYHDPAFMRTFWTSTPDFDAGIGYLKSLPPDVKVAAFPLDADVIPMRALKSVLANRETAMAYYLGFYRPIAEKLHAELAACYADNWADVDALYDRYGVRVFLVNAERYRPKGSYIFSPFNQANRERVKRNKGRFVLMNPPPDRVLFKSGDISVIRVGPKR